MKAGLYVITSVLFLIAVAVATYMVNPSTYSFDVFGIHLPSLPIALWVALPVALLAIFSFLHILFYGTKSFFQNKKLRNDINRVDEAVYWSLIKEPTQVKFNNQDLQKKIGLLANSTLDVIATDNLETTDKLKDVVSTLNKINSGEWIDLKKVKFAKHLSENNTIAIKNELNHIDSDNKYALKVVDFRDKYKNDIVQKALDTIIQTEDFFTLKKYAKDIGKERFFKLLDRVKDDKDNKLGFSLDMFKSFMDSYNLECKDYYKGAEVLFENSENPEANLELYKAYASKDDKATAGYLYLLFRYEMLDKVRDVLDEHTNDEYRAFRGLLTLKRAKHNIKLDEFINEINACKWV